MVLIDEKLFELEKKNYYILPYLPGLFLWERGCFSIKWEMIFGVKSYFIPRLKLSVCKISDRVILSFWREEVTNIHTFAFLYYYKCDDVIVIAVDVGVKS